MNHPSILASIVPASDAQIEAAALRLRTGGLVAFPTETVYGLGAVIACDTALQSIFTAKGRPFSDPLIAHVSSMEMAATLWNISGEALNVCEKLCDKFWPGPLTLVVPAAAVVSKVVTAGGDTVGVRMPAHPVARKLIAACGLPVAAPSANRFGHVSPTTAQHVYDDLMAADVVIVDGGPCQVGIESTVVRVTASGALEILRRGAVTVEDMESALREPRRQTAISVVERFSVGSGEVEVAPGQLLIHYAPMVPAFLLSEAEVGEGAMVSLGRCALVDFGRRRLSLAEQALVYRDLSPAGNASEACGNVFSILRELEVVSGLEAILLPDFTASADEALLALADRLRRASALRRARLGNGMVEFINEI